MQRIIKQQYDDGTAAYLFPESSPIRIVADFGPYMVTTFRVEPFPGAPPLMRTGAEADRQRAELDAVAIVA